MFACLTLIITSGSVWQIHAMLTRLMAYGTAGREGRLDRHVCDQVIYIIASKVFVQDMPAVSILKCALPPHSPC